MICIGEFYNDAQAKSHYISVNLDQDREVAVFQDKVTQNYLIRMRSGQKWSHFAVQKEMMAVLFSALGDVMQYGIKDESEDRFAIWQVEVSNQ